jgi:hypothetical protein
VQALATVSRLVTWDQLTHFDQFLDQIPGLDLGISQGAADIGDLLGETPVEPSPYPLVVIGPPALAPFNGFYPEPFYGGQ